ncbi:cation:proton antiporter [Natronocalculus amylovorans]|uniref:Cation:proton antiporter n=1 Tax=Natronocalculus amylovorans TaxID=2917812 RepID=A0AAE3FZ08_9EURY|nr:cation:proton antiporter [Natronocalculus amylovorans]MCL9817988.1 cation:proton antiporter [Natronocalculus amylovorans]
MSLTGLIPFYSFPIEEPVYVFTLAIAAFFIGPLLIKRVGFPGIVGIVILGALLGPGGSGLVAHSDGIILLGEVGLIYLLFTVGLELDLQGFSEDPQGAAIFGLTSFFLPFFVGTAAGIIILNLEFWAAVLLAAVFASHTLLSYPIANQYGVTKNKAVTAVFGGILFTDTLALVILAVVTGAVAGGLSPMLFIQIFGSVLLLFAATWYLAPPVARWFFQNLSEESYFEFLLVLTIFFAAASFAEVLDIAPILGAFVAGIALNRLIAEGGILRTRIEFVGNALFIPFFLIHVGMLVDFSVIFDGVRTLEVAFVIITVMVVMKAVAAWVVSKIQGYDINELGLMFGLSTGQAAAALAITLIGFDIGLFSEAVLNAVVLMLLATALISPFLTERYASKLALSKEVEVDTSEVTDPRIILPLSHNAEAQRRLLEYSFVLKGDNKNKPVHIMTVVRPQSSKELEASVSRVRTDLDSFKKIGNQAEVPIDVETRINHNPASGIVQGAVEVQSNLILMGWDGSQSFSKRMFGTVIDQVLSKTTLPVHIARLGHPINTTKRILVVIPSGVDRHAGFFENVHFIKKIAAQLGTTLRILVVNDDVEKYEHRFGLVEPEASMEFVAISGWDVLLETLNDETTEDDFVAVLSTRPGEIGWDDRLQDLPAELASLPPASFTIMHPREDDPEYDRQFLRFT